MKDYYRNKFVDSLILIDLKTNEINKRSDWAVLWRFVRTLRRFKISVETLEVDIECYHKNNECHFVKIKKLTYKPEFNQ